jgi:hypothetical protein
VSVTPHQAEEKPHYQRQGPVVMALTTGAKPACQFYCTCNRASDYPWLRREPSGQLLLSNLLAHRADQCVYIVGVMCQVGRIITTLGQPQRRPLGDHINDFWIG